MRTDPGLPFRTWDPRIFVSFLCLRVVNPVQVDSLSVACSPRNVSSGPSGRVLALPTPGPSGQDPPVAPDPSLARAHGRAPR